MTDEHWLAVIDRRIAELEQRIKRLEENSVTRAVADSSAWPVTYYDKMPRG